MQTAFFILVALLTSECILKVLGTQLQDEEIVKKAAELGNFETIQNVLNRYIKIAFNSAVENNQSALVNILLNMHPSVFGRNDRDNALKIATSKRYAETVKVLMERDDFPSYVSTGHALKFAASEGYSEIVSTLLDGYGDQFDSIMNDAILIASQKGHAETIKTILFDYKIRGTIQKKALEIAFNHGHKEVIKILSSANDNFKALHCLHLRRA